MPWSSQAVLAETVIVEGPSGGLFVYDGSGNLSSAAVGQTTTDPVQAITCYAGFSTFNGHGAVISLFSSTLDAQLWYTDTGSSSQGNLIASIASTAGTDPFSNAYAEGVASYQPATVEAIMAFGALSFTTLAGASSFVHAGGGVQFDDALTTSTQPDIRILSPFTTGGLTRSVVWVLGESNDTTKAAQVIINQTASPNGVTGAMLEVQGTGQTAIEGVPATATDQVFGTRINGDTTDRFFIDGNGGHQWGSGSAGADCGLNRQSANLLRVTTADFAVTALTRGLRVREGANCKQGTATLSAGTIVVANTSVTANSRIFLTAQDNNSTGALRVSARTAGTSFTITSSNAADSGVVAFEIFEPG